MKILEQHIPCPMCSSSDAYCIYSDGHGYCFSCRRRRKYANIEEPIILNNNKEPKW
jgi:hypothetical protein